jgi:hypothetical protein
MPEIDIKDDGLSLSIKEILAMPGSAVAGVSPCGDLKGEHSPCVGIDPVSLHLTPIRERVRIDIDTLDDTPLCLLKFLGFLCNLNELFPDARQIVGVYEDRNEGVVIFLPTPRDPDNARIKRVGHDFAPGLD